MYTPIFCKDHLKVGMKLFKQKGIEGLTSKSNKNYNKSPKIQKKVDQKRTRAGKRARKAVKSMNPPKNRRDKSEASTAATGPSVGSINSQKNKKSKAIKKKVSGAGSP